MKCKCLIKTNLILIILLTINFQIFAQKQGVLSLEEIHSIQKDFKLDAATKASMNALSNTSDIRKIVLNRQTAGKFLHQFKYKVPTVGITDQKSSGRCWMFTGLNVFRQKAIKKLNVKKFEFSENYLFFWDQFEKANLFLETVIKHAQEPMENRYNEWLFKNPIGDGGVWNSFANLAEKYGLVPKDVMPETANSENTRWLSKILKRKLREYGFELRKMVFQKSNSKNLSARKKEMMKDVYRILALNLGIPPIEFEWRYTNKDGKISALKKYTPKSFAKEVIGEIDFTDYVMLMNDPTRPYYKLYEIENDRNVLEGRNWIYVNLPNEEIKKFAIASIKNKEAMYASCDVGKQMNSEDGILDLENYDFESLYGIKFSMNKKERIATFESGSSHAMTLMAVDVDENEKPRMWQFENSWGASSGHEGFLTFTDKWFDEYMFRLVVQKKFLNEKTIKLLNTKPTMLPPWDPMFSFEK
ncbi:MAG: biotin transporter BioY [Bacteroidia bacterium]|nr:MAG: biotin transporter BioY [Bacteroidia bacterium]